MSANKREFLEIHEDGDAESDVFVATEGDMLLKHNQLESIMARKRRFYGFVRGSIVFLAAFSFVGLIFSFFTVTPMHKHVTLEEAASSDTTSESTTSEKPNIVFILADDLGWNAIGYEDFDLDFATPYISSIARDGIIMENYYSQELCSPGRTAFLTGRYPITYGMQYGNVQSDTEWGLPLNETIIAEVLQDVGYETYGLGKWDVGNFSPRYLPTARGFSKYMGYMAGYSYYFSKRYPNMPQFHDFLIMDDNCYYGYNLPDMHNYSTHLYRDVAVETINNHDKSKPLFMYLAFQAVHDPFEDISNMTIPDEFMRPGVADQIAESVVGTKRQEYAKTLNVLDQAVEDIVGALEDTGLMDNTYVIFTSDNGGCYKGGGKNGPLRGSKASLWEGGTRVDAFVYSPNLLKGATSRHTYLFHVSDWFKTIARMAGVDKQRLDLLDLDGVDHFDRLTSSRIDGSSSGDSTALEASDTANSEESGNERAYIFYNALVNIDHINTDLLTNASFAIRNNQYKLIHEYNETCYDMIHEPDVANEDDDAIAWTGNSECGRSSEAGEYVILVSVVGWSTYIV
jgi:arylsulfatase A-like enzyme